jgi:hypothetical protein
MCPPPPPPPHTHTPALTPCSPLQRSHHVVVQVSQIVAKEPLKRFLLEMEKDLDCVISKILRLMWGTQEPNTADGIGGYDSLRSGLSRERFAELVSDSAFSKYFKWQADQMLHHAKMVKRKVAERVRIFLNVCARARVDPLTQGIKAVFRCVSIVHVTYSPLTHYSAVHGEV